MKHKIESGIEIQSIPGIVPKFYEVDTSLLTGYKYPEEWEALPRTVRSDLLAYYYLSKMLEGHKEEARADEIRKDQKKRGM